MIDVRAPVAAGTFYDLDKTRLKKQIESCFNHRFGPEKLKKEKFVAAIVPHAGYIYSGPIAAWVYSIIEKANYIIIGPNHSGWGSDFAVASKGFWKTPLGGVVVDEKMAKSLIDNCELLKVDFIPHQNEHSIEVQLPFLQHKFGNNFKFVPISVMNEVADDTLLESCKVVGKAIAETIKSSKEKWIILASSDFSHYVPQEIAGEVDKLLINVIKKLDERKFLDSVNSKNATVCGYGAIATTMAAAKELGAKKGKLLKYATSGDVTGQFTAVVGYASMIMV